MEHEIKKAATYTAVFVLFVLAIVSWVYGCSPGVCVSRALMGAAAMYLIVSLAGRLVVHILLEAIVDSRMAKKKSEHREE